MKPFIAVFPTNMSTTPTPKSPPHTPSKRTMAVEKQSRSRTPLPNGAKGNGKVAVPENIERPEDFVQVPSTSPPISSDGIMKQNQSQNPDGHQKDGLQNGYMQSSGHHEESHATVVDLSELVPFDWEDFERRYDADLKKIDDEETDLADEIDKLSQSFMYWSSVASDKGSERARKRLRTREQYVHLAEEALEEKQRRYTQVVGAFKQALEMLRGNGL